MTTPGNRSSTDPTDAQDWEAKKKTESVNLSMGYRASLEFVIVPRTSISFEMSPSFSLDYPLGLLIDVPIHGLSRHFPSGELKCGLTWLVERGTATLSYPVDGVVVMRIKPDGKFDVTVDGKTPTVDLLAQRMIGEGKLGLCLTPDFPHAQPQVFAPTFKFTNKCDLKVVKPERPLLGELVTFSTKMDAVFGWGEFELRVIELDEGSMEVADETPGNAFSQRWGPSPTFLHGEAKWAIGFTSDECQQLTDVGQEEAGGFEFGWQLWGASPGGVSTLLLEDKGFLTVPRPRLESFKLEYDPSVEGTWEVSGKISAISPRADLQIDVALVDPQALLPDYHAKAVRLTVESDGVFEGYLGERHWLSMMPSTHATVPPPPAFALLSLPAAARDGKPGPFLPYLDFDETRFFAFSGRELTWNVDAHWLCSQEVLQTLKAPPKPTRRKSGISTIPALPPDAGDQRTALSFEDMWSDLAAWEGIVAFMYQDTEGNITLGAGNLLRTEEDARKLPLQNMDAGRVATPEEVGAAFRAVKAMPPKMRAQEYAARPTIALSDADIRQLLKKRLDNEFLPRLKQVAFKPDFESYPRCVRRALLDIVYNVGIGAFPGGFPELTTAVKARNWAGAAEHCHVKSISEDRNVWHKALFLYANTLEPLKRT